MAEEVVRYCLTSLSAQVTSLTYGNAVTVDGMCTLTASIMKMWVLIVTDVRYAVIDIGLEI